MNTKNALRSLAVAVVLQFGLFAALVQAQTIVINLADSGPGTLRSAITNAANGAVITFDPSLSGATITLSNTLTINTNLAIDASALPGGLQINGNGSVQTLNVASNTIVFLNSLTITNGSGFYGGGIQNNGTLTLINCTLSGNSATTGGGIFNDGTLKLNQCTLSGNIANNIFYPEGPEAFGGGIYNGGTLTLNQCTVSGNTAGGYYAEGGGIYGNSLAITNTIVAGNISHYGENIFSGELICGGSNIVQAAVFHLLIGPAPLNSNPNLAPLGNYGGPTQTMPPLPGSPAIDAGSDSATNFFTTDQRGYPRLSGAHVDIGAVEAQWASPGSPPRLTSPARGANGAFSFAFNTASNTDFTVLATTNLALPLGQWSILGQAVQNAPGQYQFTDPGATNSPRRFYDVVSP